MSCRALAGVLAIGVVLCAVSAADAGPVGDDHILVIGHDTVREYTLSGTLVQTIPVDPPTGGDVLARDAVVDPLGRIHVLTFPTFNDPASAQAYLSTYDPFAPPDSQWEHNTISGWSLSNVSYYGGLAISGDYVFAPDIETAGGTAEGIIRFPLNDLSSPQRFYDDLTPGGGKLWHAVKTGQDGFLYALEKDGALPGDPNLFRFDPNSSTLAQDAGFALQVDVAGEPGKDVMSVAVAADGDIYTVDLEGDIHHFNSSGTLLESFYDVVGGTDMELRPDGTLVIGSPGMRIPPASTVDAYGETVSVTDIAALDSIDQFPVPAQTGSGQHVNFVAFTPTPDVVSLDVDDSGDADALTDAVLILRYLFGFEGDALVEDALHPAAGRTGPAAIASFLDGGRLTMLDPDDNGDPDALTDGILILRYLFGFTGDSLVSDVLGPGANRTDPDEIAAFLDSYRASGLAGLDAGGNGFASLGYAGLAEPSEASLPVSLGSHSALVPEPSTLVLAAMAFAGLLVCGWR